MPQGGRRVVCPAPARQGRHRRGGQGRRGGGRTRAGGGGAWPPVFVLTSVVLLPFALGPGLDLRQRIGRALLWLGALLAALTAYIRTLGGTLGLAQDFRGPMAKPHRMWLMGAACAVAPIEIGTTGTHYVLLVTIVIIAIGSALTCALRLRAIAQQLHARA